MKNWIAFVVICFSFSVTMAQESRPTVGMDADAKAIEMAQQRIAADLDRESIESPGQVVVVYFTPRERKPASNHTERIRRIVEETAGFYQKELHRIGFEDRSMHVQRNDRGEVNIIDVVGEDKDYNKPDGRRIRNEVLPVLRERGINPDTSVLLLFCNLMDYDPVSSKISHHSPYYGGGNHLAGNAWQCDSEILDPLRFRDATPILDGEYGRITIGRHNSIFIGGVIHELGHALSLPHCRQRPDEALLGTALMGSGNRTYAQQLRGEGRGTILTQAHALRMAAHPVFNRKVSASIAIRPQVDYETLKLSKRENGSVQIQGRITSSIPVHGMVAYFDPDGRGDYDATTATAVPAEDGSFAMQSQSLRPNQSFELRLVACHVNATTSTKTMRFRVDEEGQPDLSIIRLELELTPMIDALRRGEFVEAEKRLSEIAGTDEELKAIGRRVLDRFSSVSDSEALDPEEISEATTSIALSQLRPKSASVGWLRPTYDSVPDKARLLSIGGDYFARGIYAHAPAEHVYELNGAWKRLRGFGGVQGSQFGRVNFEIQGDGKTLWKANGVTAGDGKQLDVDVQGVKTLTLIVGDDGNGANGDWGVWIEPVLSR